MREELNVWVLLLQWSLPLQGWLHWHGEPWDHSSSEQPCSPIGGQLIPSSEPRASGSCWHKRQDSLVILTMKSLFNLLSTLSVFSKSHYNMKKCIRISLEFGMISKDLGIQLSYWRRPREWKATTTEGQRWKSPLHFLPRRGLWEKSPSSDRLNHRFCHIFPAGLVPNEDMAQVGPNRNIPDVKWVAP